MAAAPGEITHLLQKVRHGDTQAPGELWTRLYPELHRLAQRYRDGEGPGHTLSPTGLIDEPYLELVDQAEKGWQNRAHFVGLAAQVMRRILVDYARSHRGEKRTGAHPNLSLSEELTLAPGGASKCSPLMRPCSGLQLWMPGRAGLWSYVCSAIFRRKKRPRHWGAHRDP